LLVLPFLQSAEQIAQVLEALDGHYECDQSKRKAGKQQSNGPEGLPRSHLVVSWIPGVSGDLPGFLSSEPTRSPTAPKPKAPKPAIVPFQCRNKNGTIAPAAPINMAKYPPRVLARRQ